MSVQPDLIKGLPVLGALPAARKDPLGFYMRAARDHGEIVKIKLGPETVFLLNHPDHIRRVFAENKQNYIKSAHYRRMRFILGDGMFTSEGETWKAQRETARPAFGAEGVKGMWRVMTGATQRMIARWDQAAEKGEEIQLTSEAMRVALDIAMGALFGMDAGNHAKTVYDALNVILPEVERRVWALTPLAQWWPLTKVARCREAIRAIDSLIDQVIDARLASPGPHHDLLSMLIKAEQDAGWTEGVRKRLRDQIVVFLIAGHETTATTLSWTWYNLSRFPLVDRRLNAEVQRAVGMREITVEDLPNLVYSRMVFDETMRLYPPGWMLTREALAEDEMGGVRIPKGATVLLCAYSMHRHPDYWQNPEGFDPSRFAPERSGTVNSAIYFPFGGGNRSCIGARMAMMEAQLILSEVARRFTLELVSGQEIEPAAMITIRPSEEIRMRVRRREEVPVEDGNLERVA